MDKEFSDEVVLQNFLLDIDCLDQLLPWSGKFNIFDVLKISRTEIRHSNMLGWLINPNENHALGDSYLKGILQRLVENDMDNRYEVFRILLMDLYSFSVYREWKNIDLLLVSSEEKCVLAIENKVGSHEHSNQLNRYRETIEYEYPGYKKIYIFLTPDGEEPSDVENWDVFTYTDIVEILEKVCLSNELQSEVLLMIRNYIDIIRRDIVEDQELIEICNKIYNKHRKALDLIYTYRVDGRSAIQEAVKEAMKEHSEICNENNSKSNFFTFHTNAMDEILPKLKLENGSWNTAYTYNYWLTISSGKLVGYFELGGNNIPQDEMDYMQKIIDILKPNDKRRESFQFKRVYKSKCLPVSEDEQVEDIKKKVNVIVNELLKMEKELLGKLNQTVNPPI